MCRLMDHLPASYRFLAQADHSHIQPEHSGVAVQMSSAASSRTSSPSRRSISARAARGSRCTLADFLLRCHHIIVDEALISLHGWKFFEAMSRPRVGKN